jgi:hypothetical protein
MENLVSTSTNIYDYEILIRKRDDNEYASYCPQLNLMLAGQEHVQVQEMMQHAIIQHVEELKANQNN